MKNNAKPTLVEWFIYGTLSALSTLCFSFVIWFIFPGGAESVGKSHWIAGLLFTGGNVFLVTNKMLQGLDDGTLSYLHIRQTSFDVFEQMMLIFFVGWIGLVYDVVLAFLVRSIEHMKDTYYAVRYLFAMMADNFPFFD